MAHCLQILALQRLQMVCISASTSVSLTGRKQRRKKDEEKCGGWAGGRSRRGDTRRPAVSIMGFQQSAARPSSCSSERSSCSCVRVHASCWVFLGLNISVQDDLPLMYGFVGVCAFAFKLWTTNEVTDWRLVFAANVGPVSFSPLQDFNSLLTLMDNVSHFLAIICSCVI